MDLFFRVPTTLSLATPIPGRIVAPGAAWQESTCYTGTHLNWEALGRSSPQIRQRIAVPIERKPLFRPDVMHQHLVAFQLPEYIVTIRPSLTHWADLIASGRADKLNEKELLPDFLTDFFVDLLGYTRPADGGQRYTLSREKHVQVDGKYADAVLGDFNGRERPVVAVEGKGTKDPLDRPFAGRKMSAVDQCYRYAINLPCDWIIVTSMRQVRLYYKGADQLTYERFDVEALADNENLLRQFVFLLGAVRVVPTDGRSHLYDLLAESEKVGRELTKKFYVQYGDMRQDAFARLCQDNPQVPPKTVLADTQKLLDRVLFCAFAEDRGLLPVDTIQKAYEHRDPYHPRPIYDNFRGLFQAINCGNAALGIHAYNGGLFAEDASLDHLQVSDDVCAYFRDLGGYDYRPPHQAAIETGGDRIIDVDILGHIFEQSITDLERLRNELDGLVEPVGPDKHKTRRKKEGAFYTPSFITRYIVEQALGGVLKDRFEQLRQKHQEDARGTARTALADPTVYTLDTLKKPERAALVDFWDAWQEELVGIRLLDPACGSGAFLIQAFDQMYAEYQASNGRLTELRGARPLLDLDKRILENNLYGVDLNEEAIEICRLSLWIKTAHRGKPLTSLDHSIRVGNSVVNDPQVHPQAFDWQAAFPGSLQGRRFRRGRRQPAVHPAGVVGAVQIALGSGVSKLPRRRRHFHLLFRAWPSGPARRRAIGVHHVGQLGPWQFRWPIAEVPRRERDRRVDDRLRRIPAVRGRRDDPADDRGPEEATRRLGRCGSSSGLPAGRPPENLSEVIACRAHDADGALGHRRLGIGCRRGAGAARKMSDGRRALAEYTGGRIFRGIVSGSNGSVRDWASDYETNLSPTTPRAARSFSHSCKEPISVLGTSRSPTSTWCSHDAASRSRSTLRFLPTLKAQEPSDATAGRLALREGWEGRKPGAYKWYEIQDTIDYWREFNGPKIVWPDISKLPRFSMDTGGSILEHGVHHSR